MKTQADREERGTSPRFGGEASGLVRPARALAISGSPRKQSNTSEMLQLVLRELEAAGCTTELVSLSGKRIAPCRACFACGGKRNCAFRNDDFAELYDKMAAADVILLGSPSYEADVSASLKAFIERASVVCDMNPGMLAHKIGAGIAVARRAGAMQVLDTINRFFLNKDMFVVGSSYWNIAYGRLPGEALRDEEGVATMRRLGQNIAWLLRHLREGPHADAEPLPRVQPSAL